jgi:hypothetical protein
MCLYDFKWHKIHTEFSEILPRRAGVETVTHRHTQLDEIPKKGDERASCTQLIKTHFGFLIGRSTFRQFICTYKVMDTPIC